MKFVKTGGLCVPLLLILVSTVLCAQSPAPVPRPDVQVNSKPYVIVFYVTGENWSRERPKAETEHLMRGHLAYLRKQIEAGRYALVGPLTDTGRVRGIVVMNAVSAEDARKWLIGDPMIQSGQFDIEIHSGMLTDLSAIKAIYSPAAPE